MALWKRKEVQALTREAAISLVWARRQVDSDEVVMYTDLQQSQRAVPTSPAKTDLGVR